MSPTATRMTADERREAILEAARDEFASTGYHGTSTETIAEAAGISQPYLFRLFGTKKELYLAATRLKLEEVYQAFEQVKDWSPVLAVPVNPTTRDRKDGGGGTYIESESSRGWASLFNVRYRMLLAYLAHT